MREKCKGPKLRNAEFYSELRLLFSSVMFLGTQHVHPYQFEIGHTTSLNGTNFLKPLALEIHTDYGTLISVQPRRQEMGLIGNRLCTLVIVKKKLSRNCPYGRAFQF